MQKVGGPVPARPVHWLRPCSGTWFQKIAVSRSQNAGSIWTKRQTDTTFLRIQPNASLCGQGLSLIIVAQFFFCMKNTLNYYLQMYFIV